MEFRRVLFRSFGQVSQSRIESVIGSSFVVSLDVAHAGPARPRITRLNPTRHIARRRHAGSVLVAFWLVPRVQVACSHLVRSMARVDLSAECKSGFLFMKSLSFDLGQEKIGRAHV